MLCAALAMTLTACNPGALLGLTGTPPQAPAAVTNISRSALDFALHSFDTALYGLDFAMDAGALQPGSANARQIAAVGRRVMNFLGAAEAARDLGNSPTYEAAFQNANTALNEFRALFPTHAAVTSVMADVMPMTAAHRQRILNRLVNGPGAIAVASR